MTRSADGDDPNWSLATAGWRPRMLVMQVIASSHTRLSRPGRSAIVLGAVVGGVLLVGGLAVAWLTFGTPFISRFTPVGRPTTTEIVAGVLAWTFALVAPSAFILAGIARIASLVDALAGSRPRPTPVLRAARSLPDDYVVVSRFRLSDGRIIPDLVLGPFGVAVVEELPPAGATRRHGAAWEVRGPDGRWLPLENPLEKASRDADRVRRWLAQDDNDFVVKVHAAVVARDESVERTDTCAVITQAQIPAWLRALPAQRSLSPSRRERLVELIRSVV
jgi:hypothetical protein